MRKKIFYNSMGILTAFFIMIFAFSSKSEASIADFVAMMQNPNEISNEASSIALRCACIGKCSLKVGRV